MTKDYKYPEEIKMNEVQRLVEKEPLWKKFMKEEDYQDKYCDCHERCPRCGKKYKPNTNWGTYLKHCERT